MQNTPNRKMNCTVNTLMTFLVDYLLLCSHLFVFSL